MRLKKIRFCLKDGYIYKKIQLQVSSVMQNAYLVRLLACSTGYKSRCSFSWCNPRSMNSAKQSASQRSSSREAPAPESPLPPPDIASLAHQAFSKSVRSLDMYLSEQWQIMGYKSSKYMTLYVTKIKI